MTDRERLARFVGAFVTAESWAESRGLLESEQPDLFTLVALLRAMETDPRVADSPENAENLQQHREVVQRVITVGAGRAFAEAEAASLAGTAERLRAQQAAAAEGTVERRQLTEALGVVLLERYDLLSARTDLDEAITALTEALTGPQETPGEVAATRANLAEGLRRRYERAGDAADLESAIEQLRIATCHGDVDDRALILVNFAVALDNRFEHHGDRRDLDEAVDVYEQALRCLPASAGERPMVEAGLAAALRSRHLRFGSAEDARRADELFAGEGATSDVPSPDVLWIRHNATATQAANLARPLDEPQLDETIAATRALQAATIEDSQGDLLTRANLAGHLHERSQRLGRQEDLEEAIALLRRVLECTDPASPARAGRLNNLAHAMLSAYRRSGDLDVLDESADLARQAVAQVLPTAPDRPTYLGSLASRQLESYLARGRVADLEAAVANYREAARVGHRSSPEHVIRLNNFGAALRTLWRSRREQSDLAECLALHRAVLEAAPQGHRGRSSFLHNLATVLLDASDVAKPAAAVGALRGAHPLAEAASLLEEAIGCSLEGAAELPIYVNTLGNVRFREWEVTGRSDLLDGAIEQYERAARLAADGSPDQWTYCANTASAKGDRALRSGDESELDDVFRRYRQMVTDAGPLESEDRLRAARGWGRVAVQASRWAEAAVAFRHAIDTVEELVDRQSAEKDKEHWLAAVSGVAASAAYTTARTGDWLGAAAAMERGRAVLLSEALDLEQQELEQLAAHGNSAEVEQFVGANHQLAALERVRRLGGARPQSEPADRHYEHRLVEERRRAIEGIRAIPGHEEFLRPPRSMDLAALAPANTLLIYLLATSEGGAALTVDCHRGAHVVWLPGLNDEFIRPRVEEHFDAYAHRQTAPASWRAAIDRTGRWLWEVAMGPLLQSLPLESRLVLIPSGLLGLLPLHAAWTEAPERPCGRTYALDLATITYAPNARAHHRACQRARERSATSLLAIQDPQPVTASPVQAAAAEVTAVARHFDQVTVLAERSATRERVVSELGRHDVLHCSCHAAADFAQPSRSGLLLANDQLLTVEDIRRRGGLALRLAMLSACETAATGTSIPDEAVGLPTGMLHAGAAAVVGSLWAVPDVATSLLTRRFYEQWLGHGLDPATALRRAQQWLRDGTEGAKCVALDKDSSTSSRPNSRRHQSPYWWAAFTLTGC